ncbi:hypothetical protein C0989_004712 [Termitomyces sp. Mn162]|nr:hypothetical protein C0989_004712 [Termitomyces sp. Mn162]
MKHMPMILTGIIQVYAEVPMWWYILTFVGSFAMAMATLYTGHSGLPWWGLIVGLIIATIFLPFVITVYAITGTPALIEFFLGRVNGV